MFDSIVRVCIHKWTILQYYCVLFYNFKGFPITQILSIKFRILFRWTDTVVYNLQWTKYKTCTVHNSLHTIIYIYIYTYINLLHYAQQFAIICVSIDTYVLFFIIYIYISRINAALLHIIYDLQGSFSFVALPLETSWRVSIIIYLEVLWQTIQRTEATLQQMCSPYVSV